MSSLELSLVVICSFWVELVMASGLSLSAFSSCSPSILFLSEVYCLKPVSISSFCGDFKTTTEENLICWGEFYLLLLSVLSSVVTWLKGLKPSKMCSVFCWSLWETSYFGLKIFSIDCFWSTLRLDVLFVFCEDLYSYLDGVMKLVSLVDLF